MSSSSWATYEQEVFDCFKDFYPKAKIDKDAHIKGRYSKRIRQVDILVTEKCPSGDIKIAVDAKRYKRKVDVKVVEEFEGLMRDLGLSKGILISNSGYTNAALRRAHYSPSNLELDILNFSELKQWQAHGGMPYAGNNAFLIPAPFGWVLDISSQENSLCRIYQRGWTAEEAVRAKEFIYLNIWNRKKNPLTAEELDALQVRRYKERDFQIRVTHEKTLARKDSKTSMRKVIVSKPKPYVEVTIFLEFKAIILFIVLISPAERLKPNLRRLLHVAESAIPLSVKIDNSKSISKLEADLANAESTSDRAHILFQIGRLHFQMGNLKGAEVALERGIELQRNYANIKELITVYLQPKRKPKQKLLSTLRDLLTLDLTKPTVFNDAIAASHEAHVEKELVSIIHNLSAEQRDNSLEKANCLYYVAQLTKSTHPENAEQCLLAARTIFRNVLPSNHYIFKLIRVSLKQVRG